MIKFSTRITPTSATLIDRIYSKIETRNATTHILIEDISDHLPTMLLLKNLTCKPISTNMFTYGTKNLNPEEFLIDLYNQYSKFFPNDWNLNQQFERFVYILRDAF